LKKSKFVSVMPRFVVLTHDYPFLHWDLMLEHDGALRTWRLSAPPDAEGVEAEALPDHRLAYLDYEGPVSENRGTVEQWDRGTYSLYSTGDERVGVVLHGGKLVGIGTIERTLKGFEWTFHRIR
jgi:DNA polymerase Ligase (LigD)